MKKVNYSETIAVCDLKIIELMRICEYLVSKLFLDLGPRSFTYEPQSVKTSLNDEVVKI